LRLNDRFSIEAETYGVTLVEKTEGKNKDGEPKVKRIKSSFGTLYQSLIGFLHHNIDDAYDLEGLREKIESSLEIIREAEEEIKGNFRTEVKVSGRRNKADIDN